MISPNNYNRELNKIEEERNSVFNTLEELKKKEKEDERFYNRDDSDSYDDLSRDI